MARTLILTFLAFASLWGQGTGYDIVVAGARVIDGTATPWFYADIGVTGDTIAAIGHLSDASAALRIGARGVRHPHLAYARGIGARAG